MVDVDAVRAENFRESLRQANRYLALGLFSALFLTALTLDPAAFTGNVSLFSGLPSLPVRYAVIALALVYCVAPFLADFALARAGRIAFQLRDRNLELLKAALTFPSIATTRVHGPRWVVAFVPPILVGIAGWTNGFFSFDKVKFFLFILALVPYLSLFFFRLRSAIGGLPPDAYGD